jgi:hypothetical protein
MSKPAKQSPRRPRTEEKQAPFWLGVRSKKRARRLTDRSGFRKGWV